jgi:hypothetical protein
MTAKEKAGIPACKQFVLDSFKEDRRISAEGK